MKFGVQKVPGSNRHGGFDLLRVVAMAMIFVQHAMAVHGHYESTTQLGINLGQAGVGVFCGISGYLAFHAASGHPAAWLKRRLLTVFPAYWVVTVIGFALALAAGNDKPTFFLFLSQMLGTGYFTHGWELVNVVSWFVSLILLCYLIALVVKLSGREIWFLPVVALLCAVLVAARQEVDLSRHILTFCLAGSFACLLRHHDAGRLLLASALALLGAGAVLDAQFIYAGFALLLLGLALKSDWNGNVLIDKASRHSYEFFLVHGIFLVGATKAAGLPPLAQVAAALAASIVFSPLLHLGTGKLIGAIRQTK